MKNLLPPATGITGLILMLIALLLYVRNPSVASLGDPDTGRDSQMVTNDADSQEDSTGSAGEDGVEEKLPEADSTTTGIFLLVHAAACMYFRFLFLEISPKLHAESTGNVTAGPNWTKNKYSFWCCAVFLIIDVLLFGYDM